jgi:hypothetical protein
VLEFLDCDELDQLKQAIFSARSRGCEPDKEDADLEFVDVIETLRNRAVGRQSLAINARVPA